MRVLPRRSPPARCGRTAARPRPATRPSSKPPPPRHGRRPGGGGRTRRSPSPGSTAPARPGTAPARRPPASPSAAGRGRRCRTYAHQPAPSQRAARICQSAATAASAPLLGPVGAATAPAPAPRVSTVSSPLPRHSPKSQQRPGSARTSPRGRRTRNGRSRRAPRSPAPRRRRSGGPIPAGWRRCRRHAPPAGCAPASSSAPATSSTSKVAPASSSMRAAPARSPSTTAA